MGVYIYFIEKLSRLWMLLVVRFCSGDDLGGWFFLPEGVVNLKLPMLIFGGV